MFNVEKSWAKIGQKKAIAKRTFIVMALLFS